MKYLGFFLVCFTSVSLAQSYDFSMSNSSYTELSGGTDITGGELWDDEVWYVDFGFDFDLFGSTISGMNVDSDGFLFDTLNGIEAIVGLSRVDLVDGAFLIDFNNPIPITYETSGPTGDQVFKIQWKTANTWGGDSTDVCNYQIWFHELSGNISFHFGDFSLLNMGTLSVQLLDIPPHFQDGICLTGDPLAPSTTTLFNQELDSSPSNGMVYTFQATGIASIGDLLNGDSFQIWSDQSFLYLGAEELAYMELYSIKGQKLASAKNISGVSKVSIADYAPGVYVVRCLVGLDLRTAKFTISR